MKLTIRAIIISFCTSLTLAVIIYFFNFLIFPPKSSLTPIDALFIEAIVSMLLGALLLLGSGGINLFSQRASVLAAATEAISGKETVGPSEVFRKDAWKPKGFVRIGFILLITGFCLLLFYFASL